MKSKYKDLPVEEMVVKVLADIIQKPDIEIKGTSNLRDDLEVDSLDTIELLMEAEDAYGLEVDASEIDPDVIVTVDDMIAFVKGKMEN